MDATIGSNAVTGGQIERSVLKRVGFTHHDLIVGIAVVLLRREGDVTVNAREAVELIPVADDLLRVAAGAFHGFGDHPYTVIAQSNPPQQRIAHVYLGTAQ